MTELPAGRVVRFEDKAFNFSFPQTGVEMMRGLGGVNSVEPFDGMLFDFGMNTSITMSPRNLLFPIEIAFVRDSGEVASIFTMIPEYGLNVQSNDKVRYAIEAPVGFFEKQNIKIGSRFSF